MSSTLAIEPTTRRRMKLSPAMRRQIARYWRRFGIDYDQARTEIELAQVSGAREEDIRLSEALYEARCESHIVLAARDGYWSDFKSPLEFPKTELVKMLEEDKRPKALIERVKNGEFDG
jgi:hypothetical protein